jgi:hypothetical protein
MEIYRGKNYVAEKAKDDNIVIKSSNGHTITASHEDLKEMYYASKKIKIESIKQKLNGIMIGKSF